MSTGRRGFTLVELLVVAVLGALLLVATYRILITNQRTYTVQDAHVSGQQISRAALDVLASELREINPTDLVGMFKEQVTFRAQRAFGLACAVTLPSGGTPAILDVTRVGNSFSAGDSIFVYADNRQGTDADDAWILAVPSTVNTNQTCSNGEPAQRLRFSGQDTRFLADTVRVGAPLRSFVHHTYGRFGISGRSYVARRVAGGAAEPLVGPIPGGFAADTPSLEFTYLDATGATATVPADVAQIGITVRIRAEATGPGGQPVVDSLSTRVYLRN